MGMTHVERLISRKQYCHIYCRTPIGTRLLSVTFNPCPGNGFFCDVRRQLGGIFTPRHISNSRAHSNKISTTIPIFSVSSFSMVQLPVSHDVNIRQKSKMAAAKMKCTYLTAGWPRIISNTQWAIFSVLDRGVRILECHLWQTWAKPRWRLKPEVVLTTSLRATRNALCADMHLLAWLFTSQWFPVL